MTSIADRPEYNPCPKCGDDSDSRRARFRMRMLSEPTDDVIVYQELIDVECYACGARLATVRPLDDREAPGAAA